MKIVIAVLVVFGLVAFGVVGCGVSVNNSAVSAEAGIKAQYTQNKNNYDNYVKTVAEVAQVPDMARDDLAKVYVQALDARYGDGGSKALFQFIQEQNPNLSPALYTKIQQAVEAGRAGFAADQKMLVDKKRAYETLLGTFPNTFFAGALGFPKIKLADYDIVTSDRTEKAFETKRDTPLTIRQGPVEAPSK